MTRNRTNTPTTDLCRAEAFFYEHAGWSHNPPETSEQGKYRGAIDLARAEATGRKKGWYCQWQIDERDSSAWSDEKPAYQQYVCLLFNKDNLCIGSLSGIDFGRDGSPLGDPYARVVAAELAQAALVP